MDCQTLEGWRFMAKTIFGGSHVYLVEILRQARVRAGLRQADVAARLGRDQTFVSLIERGQRRIDVVEFFEIAKALDADPVGLFRELAERINQG
jgi:transcriptional regulator with XRE-family HTH domain